MSHSAATRQKRVYLTRVLSQNMALKDMHVTVVTTNNYQMFDALVIDPFCGALDLDQSQCLGMLLPRQ